MGPVKQIINIESNVNWINIESNVYQSQGSLQYFSIGVELKPY